MLGLTKKFVIKTYVNFMKMVNMEILILKSSFSNLRDGFTRANVLRAMKVSLLTVLVLLFSVFLRMLLRRNKRLIYKLTASCHFISFHVFGLAFVQGSKGLYVGHFDLTKAKNRYLLAPPREPLRSVPAALCGLNKILTGLLATVLTFLPLLAMSKLPCLLGFFLLVLSLVNVLLTKVGNVPVGVNNVNGSTSGVYLLLGSDGDGRTLIARLHVGTLIRRNVHPGSVPTR